MSDIAELLAQGRRLSEMVVLVRLYAQTPYIEQCLIERQIPYRVVGSTPFYQRPEIQVLLAYLQLALNPSKRLWLQTYNTPKRYLSRALADAVWRRVERGLRWWRRCGPRWPGLRSGWPGAYMSWPSF